MEPNIIVSTDEFTRRSIVFAVTGINTSDSEQAVSEYHAAYERFVGKYGSHPICGGVTPSLYRVLAESSIAESLPTILDMYAWAGGMPLLYLGMKLEYR